MQVGPLMEWQNLIFVLSIAFAIIMLVVSIVGGAAHNDTDHDHDIDGHEHAVDFDDSSMLDKFLITLGIGRVPLSVLMLCWCLMFGFVGLLLNMYLLVNVIPLPLLRFGIAAGSGLFVSLLFTALIAKGLGKIMPKLESYVEKTQDFIDREADVLYSITATSGTVTLRDKFGNLQQIPARLDTRWENVIQPGTKVVLMSFDEQVGAFKAIPLDQVKLLTN